MTGPSEDERVKRRGKGDCETYFLEGVLSLLLPWALKMEEEMARRAES